MEQRKLTKCPFCTHSRFKILGRVRKWFRSKLRVECAGCGKQFEI